MNLYDFIVTNNVGEEVALNTYQGKVVLIVNTATQCGLTPQYEELEALYKKYQDQGFEILDFPCNQFKEQAPESDAEITQFCSLNYGTTFPRFTKVDVNGETAIPLYKWLKEEAPKDTGNAETKAFEELVKPLRTSYEDSDIIWNFGKFLVDRKGNVVERFSPAYKPTDLQDKISTLCAIK